MLATKINIILLIVVLSFISIKSSYAQEQDSLNYSDNSADTLDKPSRKNIFKFLKKKQKTENEDKNSDEDKNELDKEHKSFKFSNLFRKKNNNDSIISETDLKDSVRQNNKFTIFNKNKENSTDSTSAASRPKRLFPGIWNKMTTEQQDSLFRAWDEYDRNRYKEKKRYKFSHKEVEVAIKLEQNRNLYEKLIYNHARNKPFNYKKKLITRMNSRYRRTLWFERFDKSETTPTDSISDKRRYQIVNSQFKRESKRETIRKNKMVVKYDKKEDRLRRKYELNDNEKIILNKGKAIPLNLNDQLIYKKASKKREKFSEKILKIRKERAIALQNKSTRKHMKEKEKMNKKRDKERYAYLFGRKKKKKDEKFNSYEYPQRYEKNKK
jgi:hypothetical protein